MKLKAPEGVGNPCVAGMIITPRDGVYEVGPAIGVLLIECFGFAEVEAPKVRNAVEVPVKPSAGSTRRRQTTSKRA